MMDEFAEEEVVENPTLRAAYNLAPLHQNQPLRWDYKVHLIGEKIYDKVIHLCEICELPILVYGRMLPCKHIFCFDCARKCDKSCRRCSAKVQKVEKSALGTVFVCTHGAPKHSTKGCRRTYLSQRDLQSHIAHRHIPKASSTTAKPQPTPTTTQPVPNQLPLTQQQAAQQAAQKQLVGSASAGSISSHLQSSPVAGQNSMVTPVSSLPLSHPQPSGAVVSPAPPIIPGLGELRPVATAPRPMVSVGPPLIGHNSPLIHSAPSPSNLPPPQNIGMSYSGAGQSNPDIYRPLDMAVGQQHQGQHQHHQNVAMASPQQQQQQQQQHHQHHQNVGMASPHIQTNQPLQPYPQSLQQSGQALPNYSQPQQFPVSTPVMQQMSSQQLAPTMSGQMHASNLPHQHSPLSVSQPMDAYNKSQNMNLSPAGQTSQPRSNNLITVPIQDEGQYRPFPNVNPSMGQQTNASNYLQGAIRPGIPAHSQPYSQPAMSSSSFSSPVSFPQMGSQGQNMVGVGNNSTQGLPFNPSGNLRANSPNLMVNQRPGLTGNIHTGMPRALAGMVHAISMAAAARAQGGGGAGGLMPTPGQAGQPVGNRFPPGGRWAAPRVIQPRMTQNQQRPRAEGQFNPGPYYN